MTHRIAKNKHGETIKIPVLDVRASSEERELANKMVKYSNGNMSKYVPAKYGFSVHGPVKY